MEFRICVIKFAVILFLLLQFLILAKAQSTDDNNDMYFVIKNSIHEQVEKFKVGDSIQFKLTNKEKIKGPIHSIHTDHVMIENKAYKYVEIKKIRLIKNRSSTVLLGGALITAGIVSMIAMPFYADFDDMPMIFSVSLGSILTGIIIIPPKYYNLSKSMNLIVISPDQ